MSSTNINDPTTWRQAVTYQAIDDIPYRMVSRSGNFSADTATAQESYIIEASRLLDFARAVLPQTFYDGAGKMRHYGGRLLPGSSRVRTKSLTWKAFVDGLPIDPYGGDSGAPDDTYKDLVLVDIDYETSDIDDDETTNDDDITTFLEMSANAAGEFHPYSAKGKWEGDGKEDVPGQGGAPAIPGQEQPVAEVNKDITIPITKLVPQTEWNVRWPHVPYDWGMNIFLPWLNIFLGEVNSLTMKFPPITSPPETLLFLGYNYSEERQWNESIGEAKLPPLKFDLKFLEKKVLLDDFDLLGNFEFGGHNHHFRPKVGKWMKWIVKDDPVAADREFLYTSADLNMLFGIIGDPPA